jgi:hypothetical protein
MHVLFIPHPSVKNDEANFYFVQLPTTNTLWSPTSCIPERARRKNPTTKNMQDARLSENPWIVACV